MRAKGADVFSAMEVFLVQRARDLIINATILDEHHHRNELGMIYLRQSHLV